MTLITCAMTDDYVAMVGDRRLIYDDGRIADDSRNKLVLCEGNLVFGYTGLANLNHKRTDQWIMEELAKLKDRRVDEKLSILAQRMKRELDRSNHIPQRYRMLAILGVGFARELGQELLRPYFWLISNFHGSNWKPVHSPPSAVVLLARRLENGQNLDCETVGQPMPSEHEQLVRRQMSRLHESARLTGRTMIPLLADAVRQVAKVNSAVGKNLLAVTIPRASVVPGKFMLTAGTGNDTNPTFLFMRDGDPAGEHYGPAVTVGGLQVLDMRYGPASRDGKVHRK